MLEYSNKYKISKKNRKTFKNNGTGGIKSFIEENSKTVIHKRTSMSWEWKSKNLKNGQIVKWKDKFILPVKLDVSGISTQSITERVDK